MENLTNEQMAEFLGNLSVMELIKLTKDLEQKWGLEAKPQTVFSPTVQPTEDKVAVQTEFNVVFVSFPADKKMTLVKLVREVLGLGLLESKNLVESLPKNLKEGCSKEEADALKARFVEAGAQIEVK
jgi:large subunit ribosomal protein L7/L12